MSTFTLSAPVQAQCEIRKSRFIGHVIPVDDRDAAVRQLHALREQHPGAAHVCWALLAGGQSGMSDDGEPSGTAGRPIMEVLRHHDLDGVLAAVVRYYGGVKLGAGGLVRAYTDAIALALKDATRVERVARADISIKVDYADEARVRRWVEQRQYALVGSEHGDAVTLVIRVPSGEATAVTDGLRELTNGRCLLDGPALQ
ncbi:MAG TPA: YigZ family protein [Noviherbaspirillum sp.]